MPLVPSSISPFPSSFSSMTSSSSPTAVSRLTVRDQTVGADFSISDTITELEFYNVRFLVYPAFPARISSLAFEDCRFTGEVRFHEGLQRLHLGFQPTIQMVLPSSLLALSIRKMQFPTFPELPEGLQRLRLLRCNSPPPSAFPESLLGLAILDCRWRRLPPFPSSLQGLVLDELELDTLPPIPLSVTQYHEGDVTVQDRPGNEGV